MSDGMEMMNGGGILTPEAEGMLAGMVQEADIAKEQEDRNLANAAAKAELLDWCKAFVKRSRAWRETSFESNWRLYQRNSDAIYDPAKKKEAWQSKAFMALTPSHRETIQSHLFRTLVGPRPMIEMKARTDIQEGDQSQNIRDLVLREMDKTEFEVEINKVLEDVTTFGSGFARIRYERKSEERLIRTPQYAPVDPAMLMAGQMPQQPQVIGYDEAIVEVPTYTGVRFEFLSIWDIYPDPKALEVGQGPIAYRYKLTLGEIVAGAEKGYYDPESVERLRYLETTEKEDNGKEAVLSDRGTEDAAPKRPNYGKVYDCYEVWAKLPQKWVKSCEQITGDPEKLVPARIQFHQDAVLAREVSEEYAGIAPIYKMDYWPLNNQFYGRGIPEMLKDYQELINETTNQRIDNVSLVMNKGFAVIERALINPNDLTSKPGFAIRLDAKHVQDVRQALMELPFTDVTQSAYREIYEYERGSQERTSANRATMGTQGQVKDANQTLGGMEMLQASAGQKFAYVGMIQEFGFMRQVSRAFYRAIYANITPQEVIEALGQQRAMTFQLLSPEEVEKSYFYIPQGVFTMENKAMSQARVDAIYRTFALEPFVDKVAFFDRELKYANEDPTVYKLSPEEMSQQMMATAMLQDSQGMAGGVPASQDKAVQEAAKRQDDMKKGKA